MTPSDFQTLQKGHQELSQQVKTIARELQQNTDATKRVDAALASNSEATARIEKVLTGPLLTNMQEMSTHFDALKGGLTVLGWIGKAGEKLLWLGIPGALILGSWSHLKAFLGLGPKT